VCGRNLITSLTSASSPRVDISSTCRVGQNWSVSPSVDMLPFGVTIPATVPQRSEIPKGLTNYPVLVTYRAQRGELDGSGRNIHKYEPTKKSIHD
jgi:hypothetical protein